MNSILVVIQDGFAHWVPIVQWVLIGIFASYAFYWIVERIIRYSGLESFIHRILRHAPKIGKDSLSRAVAKYLAAIMFVSFVRKGVELSGYIEVEKFFDSMAGYLPYLFGAVFVFYIGIQTSKTFFDIVYNAMAFDNPRTARVIAHFTRVIFLFFIFTVVINLINAGTIEIIPDYLIKAILIGFVASTSLALGLAFGLGWIETAREFVQDLWKKHELEEKNLKK